MYDWFSRSRDMGSVWYALRKVDFILGAGMVAAGVENLLHGGRILPDDRPWCFSADLACAPGQNLMPAKLLQNT